MRPPPWLRVLVLADTHLGIDTPLRPRVERRRRGDDFFACFERALEPALRGEVDVVVHAGDVFHRPHVPDGVVERGMAALARIAQRGTPVLVVPGNHERSVVTVPLHLRHPELHVFAAPRTIVVERAGMRVAFGGLPFVRRGVRGAFRGLVADSGVCAARADARVLCLHQCIEGATCGPGNFTFRSGDDVIAAADLPTDVALVVAGHVHRHQILERDLGGRPLPAPVLYPGSVERTSFAEQHEAKGFGIVELAGSATGRGAVVGLSFRTLPARPMVVRRLVVGRATAEALRAAAAHAVGEAPADAIVRLVLEGDGSAAAEGALGAAWLRTIAPPTMNVELVPSAAQGGTVSLQAGSKRTAPGWAARFSAAPSGAPSSPAKRT